MSYLIFIVEAHFCHVYGKVVLVGHDNLYFLNLKDNIMLQPELNEWACFFSFFAEVLDCKFFVTTQYVRMHASMSRKLHIKMLFSCIEYVPQTATMADLNYVTTIMFGDNVCIDLHDLNVGVPQELCSGPEPVCHRGSSAQKVSTLHDCMDQQTSQ